MVTPLIQPAEAPISSFRFLVTLVALLSTTLSGSLSASAEFWTGVASRFASLLNVHLLSQKDSKLQIYMHEIWKL